MGFIKRRQLFEFSDLPRWPKLFRSLATDYLLAVAERFRPFTPKLDAVARAMEAVGTDRVVDLCSGTGGPWPHLGPELARILGRPISLILTDRYPHPEAEHRLKNIIGASYFSHSVDARHVPPQLAGMRTLYNGFHHFEPDQARQILQDAVDSRQPIAVFEMLERTRPYFAYLLLTPLLVLILTPKIRPIRLSRLVWSFLIPVVPFTLLWDSLVSVLRCYTPEELTAMTDSLGGEDYVWEIGTYRSSGLPVTYLVGHPQSQGKHA